MASFTFFTNHRNDDYNQEQSNLKKRITKFSVFVVIGLLIVTIIIGSMFYFNYQNNSIYMFVDASAAAFESGSFDYKITARINSDIYMDYQGSMEFDLDNQEMTSVYHAQYDDYQYDTVIYAKDGVGYDGTYYGGKWTVDDYTSTSLDFFDFFRSYSKKSFNSPAFMRFTGNTRTFNAAQLKYSVEDIIEELSSIGNLNKILHQDISADDGKTVVTFDVELDKVYDIVIDNIAPAYSSANDFIQFKEHVQNNQENLKNTVCKIKYTINENDLLTDLQVDYTANSNHYTITCQLSNFANTKANVPDGFFAAANMQID